jgi:hypothetical protein
MLDGFRGGPAVDVDALVDAIVGLGDLALSVGDGVEAIDVNPLVVHPTGAVAVDALVVPRSVAARK